MKKRWIAMVASLAFISSTLLVSAADDSTTRSLQGDFFNKVFDVELTDGSYLLETKEETETRESINNDIWNGTDQEYSLYDRFGPDIRFIPYFGEVRLTTGILDRFYTELVNNNEDFALSKKELEYLLFSEPAISNNAAYDTRPDVLPMEDIANLYVDPRVVAYSPISSTGGDAQVGNLLLGFSSNWVSFTSYINGNALIQDSNKIMTDVFEGDFKSTWKNIINFLLPICLMVFLGFLIKKIMEVVKGDRHYSQLIRSACSAAISLGIVYFVMYNPMGLNDVLLSVTNFVENGLDSMLVDGKKDNEVIYSDSLDHARSASLWNINVFDPWCYGMFDDSYDQLYTQFSDQEGKMEQSHDDVQETWEDGEVRYNSAALTGDIKIPLGNGKEVQNWAALAWSTQSKYHIDAVDWEKPDNEMESWPRATTTFMNKSIYVDNFRWLDAQLNISPEYHGPNDAIMNYSHSRLYQQHFIQAGLQSIYRSILLAPITIISVKKLYAALMIILASIQLCIHSMGNFLMPERFDAFKNLKKLTKNLGNYLWWQLISYISLIFYTKMVGASLVVEIIWMVIGIYLVVSTPKEVTESVKNGAQKVQKWGTAAKKKIQSH